MNALGYAQRIKPPVLITISGSPGSGKSSVAQKITQTLGGERIYVGSIRREMARKRGMTIEQLNIYALNHPETDVDVDKEVALRARELYSNGLNVFVEGRTQFYFLQESLKIYIYATIEEGARRIWESIKDIAGQMRNEDHVYNLDDMISKYFPRLWPFNIS